MNLKNSLKRTVNQMKHMENIAIVGLGKLGLCFAACLADKGYNVYGVDVNQDLIDKINRGIAPWYEPGLDVLLKRHGGRRLTALSNHCDAVSKSEASFVLVGTPSLKDGSFSNEQVEKALIDLGIGIKKAGITKHLVVISSTVMPGSTDKRFIPILQETTGLRLNDGLYVCYDPDFVALGNVINGFYSPDLVLIGESCAEAGDRVNEIHRKLCANNPPVHRMSIISAEIAKMCLNAYITTKITFANCIANICEHLPGADVDAITNALGSDRRISPYYFRGGLGFGGTCFPRDVRAYIGLVSSLGIPQDLIRAVDIINNFQHELLIQKVEVAFSLANIKSVGILGMAFTANTPVITGSPAVILADHLINKGIRIIVHDYFASNSIMQRYGEKICVTENPEKCLREVGVCVLTHRSESYKAMVETFHGDNEFTLIDCWRQIDPSKLNKNVKYQAVGRYV